MSTTTNEPPITATFRDLTPEEIAALDIDTVSNNNSTAVEELMKKLSHTSTLD